MRIFISYAAEQRPLAERLHHSLRNEGYSVFFDRASLPPGEAFAGAIQREIAAADLFIFLISPESISARYALSELSIMEEAAPAPGKRVLPVMASPVPIDSVPSYLRPLTILNSKGDMVADIMQRVADIAAARRRIRFMATLALLLLVAASGSGVWWRFFHVQPSVKPTHLTLLRSLSLFRQADETSEIFAQLKSGDEIAITPSPKNPNWVAAEANSMKGWAMAQDIVAQQLEDAKQISLGRGFGFQGSFWRLFFTSPQKEGRPVNRFGIDVRFADAVNRVQKTLDIAVFEFNSKNIADAIVEAFARGVKVRVVTGKLGFDEKDAAFSKLQNGGIPVVVRPVPYSFMHNKFAILDGKTVWAGSWNYTDGATYTNNENAIALDGQDIALRYQKVFNQMFEEKRFGKSRRPETPLPVLSHGVVAMFAPEDPVLPELLKKVGGAQHAIRFMAFSLTLEDFARALLDRANSISVQGILEKRMARTARASRMLCASGSKLDLRLGSAPHFLHHDVIVVDDELVITGSLSFAKHGTEDNDENLLMIPDRLLARKYLEEFARLWTKAAQPGPEFCQVEPPRTDSE